MEGNGGNGGAMGETCDNGKQSMSTDRLIARLMPKGNQLPRWREALAEWGTAGEDGINASADGPIWISRWS
ncbi:hypothetical protein N7501_006112 [Penicillium viridicatum]|nr:hypothetical protein N7501_006112 [Penicillium viridicatum]